MDIKCDQLLAKCSMPTEPSTRGCSCDHGGHWKPLVTSCARPIQGRCSLGAGVLGQIKRLTRYTISNLQPDLGPCMLIGRMGCWHNAPVYNAGLANPRLMPYSGLIVVTTMFGVSLNPSKAIMIAVFSVLYGDHH